MNKRREKYIKLRCIEKKIEPIENSSNSYCMFIPAKDLSRVYKMKHNYVQNAKRVTITLLSAGNKKSYKTINSSEIPCCLLFNLLCVLHLFQINSHHASRLSSRYLIYFTSELLIFQKISDSKWKFPHFHNEIWFLLC